MYTHALKPRRPNAVFYCGLWSVVPVTKKQVRGSSSVNHPWLRSVPVCGTMCTDILVKLWFL